MAAWENTLPAGYEPRAPKPLAPSTRGRWSRPWYFMLRDLWENGGYGWQEWGNGHQSSGITMALTSRKMIEAAETSGRGNLLFRLTPAGYQKLLDLYEERAEAAESRGEEFVDPEPPEGAPLLYVAPTKAEKLAALGLGPCGCMLEDDGEGGEKVMTHGGDCPEHPMWTPAPPGTFATRVVDPAGRAVWVGCGHPAERDINDNCYHCHAVLVKAA